MALKLYYAKATRAVRPRWLLEELGIPYELQRVELGKDNRTPEYLRIHPHGAVPALDDDGTVVFESSAIVLYLADKFPDKRLAPEPGTRKRAHYYQWIAYALCNVEPINADIFQHTKRLPEPERLPALVERRKGEWKTVGATLERHFTTNTWALGDGFSAADVVLGATCVSARNLGLLQEFPAVQAYVARVTERPAFLRARAD
jgi:glutathione S-transferase